MNLVRPVFRANRRLALVALFIVLTGLFSTYILSRGTPAARAGVDAALAYSTYLGDNGVDDLRAITVDAAGNIYIAGITGSNDFWSTGFVPSGYNDIFVAKLNPAGSDVAWLHFLGSSGSDTPQSIQVDGAGNAIVTVNTYADDWPVHNALWPERPHFSHDGALFKLNSNGDLVYSTYLPLDVFDGRHNLAVDAAGNAYVTGADFRDEGANQIALLKISPNGQQLLLEKYIGGPDSEKGTAIARDAAGNIYLTGIAEDNDTFPVTANAHQPECGDLLYEANFYCYEDGVVAVLDSSGQVTYSSYHGGSFTDEPQAIATDGKGNILIAGNTGSGQFPLANALQTTCPIDASSGECRSPRGFVSMIRLNSSKAALAYSTYLGSTEHDSTTVVYDAAMTGDGQGIVTGYTNGRHFPVAGAPQPLLAEGFCTTFGSERYCFDAFAVTFAPGGGLGFGTYLGGAFDDFPYDLALANGDIYVTGMTESNNFPTTADALQPGNLLSHDGFITRIGAGVAPPPVGPYSVRVPVVIR